MIWIQYAPAALIALVVVLLAVRPLAALGIQYGWVYQNKRATAHTTVMPPVPFVGGAALVLGLLAAALIAGWPAETIGLGIGLVVVFVLGVLEDRWPMRRRFWFAGMVAAAAAAVIGGQHFITHTGPVLGPFEIPLSIFSLPFTIAFVGVIALGFRTIDRADGLCDGQALISSLALTIVAIILASQQATAWPLPGFAAVAQSLIGALLGLAFYTWRRPGRRLAAIYLGSAGAMMLGLLLGWLALQVHAGFGEAGIGIGGVLWLFAVPLADLLFYGLRRLLAGQNWTAKDRFRLYHMLRAQHYSVDHAVLICHGTAVGAAVIGIAGWALGVPDFFLFYGFWVAFAAYAMMAMAFWTRLASQVTPRANWQTATGQTIDVEAHTVMGSFSDDEPNPFQPQPVDTPAGNRRP